MKKPQTKTKFTIKTNGHALKCTCSSSCESSPRHQWYVVPQKKVVLSVKKSR